MRVTIVGQAVFYVLNIACFVEMGASLVMATAFSEQSSHERPPFLALQADFCIA